MRLRAVVLLHVLRVQVAEFKPIIPWLCPTLFENHTVAGWLDNDMVVGRLLLETVAAIPDAGFITATEHMAFANGASREQQMLVAANSSQWVYNSGVTSYGPASFFNVSAYSSVVVPMLEHRFNPILRHIFGRSSLCHCFINTTWYCNATLSIPYVAEQG